MNAPLWVVLPVIALVTLASRADVRTRKIPNRLTFPAIVLGWITHLACGGVDGLGSSLAGCALAGVMLLPGWLLRWMGAGDVKLMAAVGAWVGYPLAIVAALASFVAGGLIALIVALRHGRLLQSLRGAAVLGAWTVSRIGGTPPPVTSGVRFPFALAVLAGVTFALWAHR